MLISYVSFLESSLAKYCVLIFSLFLFYSCLFLLLMNFELKNDKMGKMNEKNELNIREKI